MIEPTIVCELDAGSPNHHVPKFHKIAAISSANTMANPAPELTCSINSTGNSVITANATVPRRKQHACQVAQPGPHHRDVRLKRVCIDHRRHSVRGVVKSVYKLETQCNQQCQSQHHVWPRAGDGHAVQVFRNVKHDVGKPTGQSPAERPQGPVGLGDFFILRSSRVLPAGMTSTTVARSAIRNHHHGRNHSGHAWASSTRFLQLGLKRE